jgi:hypothetical protein
MQIFVQDIVSGLVDRPSLTVFGHVSQDCELGPV